MDTHLNRSVADMVIEINEGQSYLIEAQIKHDPEMGVRMVQYMLNEGREGAEIWVRLPEAGGSIWGL